MSDAAANARAFSGRSSSHRKKDQPMIESGRKAVYEAIVRRKSRAAIWRAIRRGGGPAGQLAEISAWRAGEFRNLGQPVAAALSADETNPL
ncbi:hypothetical protein [Burkholderia territorii]|uniref:hypothetical protein n=2 Tax=Burkholderia territorii TaxID=1503055 RepID=UPI000A72C4FA|nr:hypothetical protein [Burkholderia territorii]